MMKDHRYVIGLDFRNNFVCYTGILFNQLQLSIYVSIFIQRTKSVLTIWRQEKVPQRFHQCFALLSPQPVVIDFEGYCLTNQPFILKEISVRDVDYHDTILLRPPHSSNILNAKALKSYNWVKKTYTVSLGIVVITIILSSSVSSSASNCDSPTYWCTQRVEKSVSI